MPRDDAHVHSGGQVAPAEVPAQGAEDVEAPGPHQCQAPGVGLLPVALHGCQVPAGHVGVDGRQAGQLQLAHLLVDHVAVAHLAEPAAQAPQRAPHAPPPVPAGEVVPDEVEPLDEQDARPVQQPPQAARRRHRGLRVDQGQHADLAPRGAQLAGQLEGQLAAEGVAHQVAQSLRVAGRDALDTVAGQLLDGLEGVGRPVALGQHDAVDRRGGTQRSGQQPRVAEQPHQVGHHEDRRARRSRADQEQAVGRPLAVGVGDQLRQARHRGVGHDGGDRQLRAEGRGHARRQPRRLQRAPAQGEEVVGDSHPLAPQDLRHELGQRDLRGGARGHVAGLHLGRLAQVGQRAPVEGAPGLARQGLHRQEAPRERRRRETLRQEVAQHVRRRAPVPAGHAGHQVGLALRVLAGQHRALRAPRSGWPAPRLPRPARPAGRRRARARRAATGARCGRPRAGGRARRCGTADRPGPARSSRPGHPPPAPRRPRTARRGRPRRGARAARRADAAPRRAAAGRGCGPGRPPLVRARTTPRPPRSRRPTQRAQAGLQLRGQRPRRQGGRQPRQAGPSRRSPRPAGAARSRAARPGT